MDVGAEDESSTMVPFRRNLERAVDMMSAPKTPMLIARRDKPFQAFYHIAPRDFLMFDSLSVSIEEEWFRSPDNVSAFVSYTKDLSRVVEVSHGYIQHDSERPMDRIEGHDGRGEYSTPIRVGPKRHLRGLFWANILGPEYVEMWGRGFLAKAPCHRVDELDEGGVILYLSESPLDAGTTAYRQGKARLLKYLGPEAFDGRREPKFRTKGRWRKKRDARPLMETGGVLDDVFADEPPS